MLDRPGVVDYCIGPVAPGVFVVVRTDDPYVAPRDVLPADGRRARTSRSTAPTTWPRIEAPLTVYEMALDRSPSLHLRVLDLRGRRRDQAAPSRPGERHHGHRHRHDPWRSPTRPTTSSPDNGVPLGVLAGRPAQARRPRRPHAHLRRRRARRGLAHRAHASHTRRPWHVARRSRVARRAAGVDQPLTTEAASAAPAARGATLAGCPPVPVRLLPARPVPPGPRWSCWRPGDGRRVGHDTNKVLLPLAGRVGSSPGRSAGPASCPPVSRTVLVIREQDRATVRPRWPVRSRTPRS